MVIVIIIIKKARSKGGEVESGREMGVFGWKETWRVLLKEKTKSIAE